MKKLIFIPIISLLYFNCCITQQMIDFTKEWRIGECCYFAGMTDCSISKCHFDSIITVLDGEAYHELLFDKPQSFNDPKYFKEVNGQVYFWRETFGGGTPYLAYDFTATIGEVVYIGVGQIPLKVEDIDSIALYDGTMRKRLKLQHASFSGYYTYWIEGIGGTDGPMNPDFTFSFDCWSSLQCYRDSSQVLYAIGDCLPTSTINKPKNEKITLYPNPAREQITIKGLEEDVLSITVFDHLGRSVKTLTHLISTTIDIKDLSSGVYLVAVVLKNGRKINTTFIVI
jgi:hypothetical protein